MSWKRCWEVTTTRTGSKLGKVSGEVFWSRTDMDSEMFLGPAGESFNFQPKHKSNSYEIQAEG